MVQQSSGLRYTYKYVILANTVNLRTAQVDVHLYRLYTIFVSSNILVQILNDLEMDLFKYYSKNYTILHCVTPCPDF